MRAQIIHSSGRALALGLIIWALDFSASAGDPTPSAAAPAILQRVGADASQANAAGPLETWRRVRSPGSAGPEATAILRVAEVERSDPRLAGLMLRCGKNGVEIVIIVVEPFPPGARPKITLRAAGHESYFEGVVIPTGAGVRAPVDGEKLARGAWRGAEEVEIKISDGAPAIEGVVRLSGLSPALDTLISDCAAK